MNSTIQRTLDLILAGQAKLDAGQASLEDGQKILVSRVHSLEYSISDITENFKKRSVDVDPIAIWDKKGLKIGTITVFDYTSTLSMPQVSFFTLRSSVTCNLTGGRYYGSVFLIWCYESFFVLAT